jgi:heme ABC exporter ATP-binding subunit CcmA
MASGSVATVGPVNGTLVWLQGVGVRFGAAEVLRDVSFDVDRDEIVGITGPNGSGKTTLLRMLATLIRPTNGEGEILGKPIGTAAAAAARRNIGLLGHVPALYPELTLTENLQFAARMLEVDGGRVHRVLKAVGLQGAAERRLDQCSNGMQRRADIARVLLSVPQLLLLDEPHAGLDRHASELVTATAEEVLRHNGAIVMVSHDTQQMIPFVDRMWRLDGGRLDLVAVDGGPTEPDTAPTERPQ